MAKHLIKLLYFVFIVGGILSCSQEGKDRIIVSPNSSYKITSDSIKVDLGTVVNAPSNFGDSAIILNPEHRFGLVVDLLDVKGGEVFDVSVYRKEHNPLVKLVADGDWGQHFVQNGWSETQVSGWEKVSLHLEVPHHIPHTKIRFFVHNPSPWDCEVNRLEIRRYTTPPETLPDCSFYPLLHQLLQDYHIRYYRPLPIDEVEAFARDSLTHPVFEHAGISLRRFITTLHQKINTRSPKQILKDVHRMRDDLAFPSTKFTREKGMSSKELEGFITNLFCTPEDTARIIIHGHSKCKRIALYKLGQNHTQIRIKNYHPPKGDLFELSCTKLVPGIYKITLKGLNNDYSIPLIINPASAREVVIIAPYTTWHAYNVHGGKSFYKNGIDRSDVTEISTLRPLNSITFDHTFTEGNLFSLLHVYQWFDKRYGAAIYPDVWLESHPERFASCKAVVLFGHCEYFSPKMFAFADQLTQKKHFISLGGNQMYWKVLWHDNYTRIECRKDGNFFKGTDIPGGLWRDELTSEARVLGVAFSPKGYGTYAPYKAIHPEHPLFDGTGLKKGQYFGFFGKDSIGICGDEMDQIYLGAPAHFIHLAKGTNPSQGGGDMVFIPRDSTNTLSCGAITCGRGLDSDPAFSTIIENFMGIK